MFRPLVSPARAVAPPSPPSGRGLYLAIGLNAIDPAHYGTEGWLRAAEADARDVSLMLRGRGFVPLSLSGTAPGLLLGPDATRAAVTEAIGRLARTTAPGDLAVIHYSGHGGQVPDSSGDELDNLDETWCLFDGQFLDDELQACLALFPAGSNVVVLSDSCHSGTVVRAQMTAAAQLVAAASPEVGLAGAGNMPTVFRTLPPEALTETYLRHRGFYRDISDAVEARSPSGDRAPVAAALLLLSACQDNQLAGDGLVNGLFTGSWLAVWRDGAFSGSYDDLYRATRTRMPPVQTPNLDIVGAGAALAGMRAFSLGTED